MIKKLKPKSEFSRNVLTLMTGTTIAQAIPIATSPILTRIYSPEDFGLLAVFLAITTILSSVVNGRYELAIGLPEDDSDAINVAALGILITIIVTLVSMMIIVGFNENITHALNNPSISFWLYWVPVSVFLIGVYNVLNYLNIREKNFKDISIANIYKSVGMVAIQLLVGNLKKGALGLISGQIALHLFANIRLYKNIRKKKGYHNKISWTKMRLLAKRYYKFPKYSMFAGLFNSLAHHASSLLISVVFNASTLGMYFLIQKVLGAPSALIATSISQVFLQRANEEKKNTGHATKTFNSTVKLLFFIALPLYSILFFISKPLFGIVFGDKWLIAGEYAMILIPYFFISFIVSTVSMMNVIFEKNHIGLYWQIVLAIITIGTLLFASIMNMSFTHYLYMLSALMSLHYLVLLLIMASYNKSAKELL